MTPIGDLEYRIECLVCGAHFLVGSLTAKVPKHPPKGVNPEPNETYTPCRGSGLIGRAIGTQINRGR